MKEAMPMRNRPKIGAIHKEQRICPIEIPLEESGLNAPPITHNGALISSMTAISKNKDMQRKLKDV